MPFVEIKVFENELSEDQTQQLGNRRQGARPG